MKKISSIVVVCLLVLSGCQKKIVFENPLNEEISEVEVYNEYLRVGAKTYFKNYYFIDLRSRVDYLAGHISNFNYKYNIEYVDESSLERIVDLINKDSRASFTVPIFLIDSGEEEDQRAQIVFNYLVSLGYQNCKNIVLGFQGLKELHQTGFPYSIQYSDDCNC